MKNLIILLILALSSCVSMVTPYEDEPLCYKGAGSGYCTSLSEVDRIIDQELKKKDQYKYTCQSSKYNCKVEVKDKE